MPGNFSTCLFRHVRDYLFFTFDICENLDLYRFFDGGLPHCLIGGGAAIND